MEVMFDVSPAIRTFRRVDPSGQTSVSPTIHPEAGLRKPMFSSMI
jgi:hypothetical protein